MNESLNTRLMFSMAGHSYPGLRLQQIADALNESSSTVLRGLQRMRDDGIAEQTESKTWRLTPRLVQIAIKHAHEVEREERKLADFKSRFSRTTD